MIPLRPVAVDRNASADDLHGKKIILALYGDTLESQAKIFVDQETAKLIDCGAPLQAILAMLREAVISSARAQGNPTAFRKT